MGQMQYHIISYLLHYLHHINFAYSNIHHIINFVNKKIEKLMVQHLLKKI